MKIKKSITKPAPAGTGGAAIADRFRLDPVAAGPAYKGPTIGRGASLAALIAGFIGLGLALSLTIMLYLHWDFLMPA